MNTSVATLRRVADIIPESPADYAGIRSYARIRYNTYGGLAREGCDEITLAPGAKQEIPMAFSKKDTDGLTPGIYQLTASLTGIPFDTTSKSVEIKK